MNRALLEYRPDINAFRTEPTHRGPDLSEAGEMREAARLLERLEEGELEAYLVELIDRVGLPPTRPVVKPLALSLTRAARRLLSRADATPAPSAGRLLGLELEGLSPEDQVFAVARRFVRLAIDSARRAARAAGTSSPQAEARRAVASAARRLAPGLVTASASGTRSTGFWSRRGGQLVVFNP